MSKNINFKTLEQKKKELANMRAEWKAMKEQEKDLKKQFYGSPKNSSERAQIKSQLTQLQEEIFEKRDCGTSAKIDTRNEELFQKLKNPTGPATNPQHLASSIKEELRAILNGSRKMETGDRVGDIWESNQSKEFCYFGPKKEIKEAIANLPRKRQEPLDLDTITTRMVRVKRKDLAVADFDEIISLIRQVKNFLEEKDKQEQQNTENIKLNNPHLFTQWKCSTDKRNGVKQWENWHTFSGKHNGFNYTIYVPDNHFALTNCLFDDGWGTNSEVSKFFVVEGAAKPTELHYWNVAQQRDEIISETEAEKLTKHDKDYYINYRTYVELDDKITIDHYKENGQQDLAKPVSGVNKLIENSNHKTMSGGVITHQEEIEKHRLDKEFLLKYFQEHDIKEISLTPEGNLLIEYNSGKSEIITSDQANSQKLQKVISYYQENNRTNLSRKDLINKSNSNSPTANPKNNNALLVGFGIGGALVIGMSIGLLLKKRNVKKH